MGHFRAAGVDRSGGAHFIIVRLCELDNAKNPLKNKARTTIIGAR